MPRYPARAPVRSSAETGGVAAVDRALLLLCAFRPGDRELTLAALAGRSHLVKSTALRLLASLIHFNFIRRSEAGLYSLGPEIARLNGLVASSFSLEDEVMPVLVRLVARTKETAAFHVRRDDRRVCLYRVDSPQLLRDHGRVGDIFPLDRGAGGRVLLAFSGARGAIYDRIRRDGYAALVGDRLPEIAGISAPVFGAGGELIGAITLTLPTHRYKEKAIGPVREAAAAVTRKLGGM
ncbi:MAG TPA: IclR family transcriptional regulator [Usitatibacteraceae bacterium]|nr:IclR family transcriptional regulator [Usitatibacteraceae bacterium]